MFYIIVKLDTFRFLMVWVGQKKKQYQCTVRNSSHCKCFTATFQAGEELFFDIQKIWVEYHFKLF